MSSLKTNGVGDKEVHICPPEDIIVVKQVSPTLYTLQVEDLCCYFPIQKIDKHTTTPQC